MKPSRQRIAVHCLRSPSVTSVTGCATTIFCLFERDDAEKQPDTGRDRELEILRDRIDDVFAQPEDGNEKKDYARSEHAGERLLPAIFVAQHRAECEQG